MARTNFGVELGFDIYDENGTILAAQIAGSAAPAAGAPFAAQPIGTIYQRSNGDFYVKTANADAAADWKLVPVQLSGSYTPANGSPTAGDSFEDAIEKLDANQQDLTTLSGEAQGATDHGTFTGTTIPDSSTTKSALQSLETAYEETDANVDDLITLSGSPENSTDHGTFTGTTIPDSSTTKGALQSLETAYEETDQNVDDLITLSGVAENSTDLGTFTGAIIPDSSTVKAALQALETYTENIEGGTPIIVNNITTLQDIDTVLVDDVHATEWEIVAYEEATPANKIFQKVTALHDGTAAADATTADNTVHTKLKTGANFNLVITVDVNGTGASQTMRLRASSSTAGVTMEVRRTGVLVNS